RCSTDAPAAAAGVSQFSGRARSAISVVVRREAGLLLARGSWADRGFDGYDLGGCLAGGAINAVCLRADGSARSFGAADFCDRRRAEFTVAVCAGCGISRGFAAAVVVYGGDGGAGGCQFVGVFFSG